MFGILGLRAIRNPFQEMLVPDFLKATETLQVAQGVVFLLAFAGHSLLPAVVLPQS